MVRITRHRLYLTGAVVALAVATYNLATWGSAPEEGRWREDYLKALIGGLTLVVIAIVLVVLTCKTPDRQIQICGR